MERRHPHPISRTSLWLYRPLLLGIAVAASVWYGNEILYRRPAMTYMGVPVALSWRPATWTHVLRNDAFLIGYSELRGDPLWVIYRLHPIARGARYYRRRQHFERDWRTLSAVGEDAYDYSGYDRGHLAPSYAISRLYGPAAQRQTYLMSNVAPQRRNLNRKVWQRLEEVAIDSFAPRFGTLWVVTGPIFDGHNRRLRHARRVEIPDAFFKIFVAPPRHPGTAPQMLAFIVPQEVKGDEPLDRFATNVDAIEARTGFDFFPQLHDAAARQTEAQVAPAPWHLREVANLPARY